MRTTYRYRLCCLEHETVSASRVLFPSHPTHPPSRSITFTVREYPAPAAFFSVDCLVVTSNQRWSLIIPFTNNISKLVSLFNKHFPSRKLALGRWILEAIVLKMNLLTISGSEIDTKLLDQKCLQEIHSMYSRWVTLIQKHVRGFLARRHPKIVIKFDHSYHTSSQFSRIRQLSPDSCMKKPFLRKFQRPVARPNPASTSRPTTSEELVFPSRAVSPYRSQSPNRPKPPSSAPLPLKPTPPLCSGLLRPPRSQHSPRNILTHHTNLAPTAPALSNHQDQSHLYQSSIFVRPLSPQNHPTHSNHLAPGEKSETSNDLPTIPAVELYDRLFALDNQDLSVLITGNALKDRERRRHNVTQVRAIDTEYILSYLDARENSDHLFTATPEQSHYASDFGSSKNIQLNQFPMEADSQLSGHSHRSQLSDTPTAPLRYQFDETNDSNPLDDESDSQYEGEVFCSIHSGDDQEVLISSSGKPRNFDSDKLRSDAEVSAAAICLQRLVRSRHHRNHLQQKLQAYLSKITNSRNPRFIESALTLSIDSGNSALASSAIQRIDALLLIHRLPQSKEHSFFQPTNPAYMALICQVISSFVSVQSVFLPGVSLLSTLSRINNVPLLLKQMGDCRCCEVTLTGLLRYTNAPLVLNSLLSLLGRLLAEQSNRQHIFSRSGCKVLEKVITKSPGIAQKLIQLIEQAIIRRDNYVLTNLLESNLLTRLLALMREVLERRSGMKIESIVRVFQALAIHRSSAVVLRMTSIESLSLFCVGLLLMKNSASAYREMATFLLTLLRRSHGYSSLTDHFAQLSRMSIQTVAYLISCHHLTLSSTKIRDDVLDTSLAFILAISGWDLCQREVRKTKLPHYLVTTDFQKKFPAYRSLAELYSVGESPTRAIVPEQDEDDLAFTYNSEEHLSGVLKMTLTVRIPDLTEQLCEDLLFTIHQVYTETTSNSCDSPCLLLLDEVMRRYPDNSDIQKICLACLDHLLQMMLGDVPFHPYHQLLQLVSLWKEDKALLKKYLEILILFNERCESFSHSIDWTHNHISLMLQLMEESIDMKEFSVLERWSYLFRGISLHFKHRLCLLRGTPLFLRILSIPEIPNACKVSTLITIPNIYSVSCPDCISGLCSTSQLVFYLTSLSTMPESCHEVVAFIIVILGEDIQRALPQIQIQANIFSSTFVELLDNINRDLDNGRESTAISSEQLLVILALLVHCLQKFPALRFQLISLGVRSRLLDLQTKVEQIRDYPDWAETDITSISRILAHCVNDLPLTPLDASEEDIDSLPGLFPAAKARNNVLQPAALLDELNQRRHSISVTSPRFSQQSQGTLFSSAVMKKRQNHLLKMNRIRADSHDFSHCVTDELISGLVTSTNAAFLMTCIARCVEERNSSFARLVLRRMEVVITEVNEKIQRKKGLEGQLHDSKIVQSIVRNFKQFIDLMEVFATESDILIATFLLLKKIPCDSGDIDRWADEGIFLMLHSILFKYAGLTVSQDGNLDASALVILTIDYAKQLLIHGRSEIREIAVAHPGATDLLTSLFLRLFKFHEQMQSFVPYLLELCHQCPGNQFCLLRAGLGSHLTKYLIENKRDEHIVQLSIRLIFALSMVSGSAPDTPIRQEICIRTLLSHRHLKLYVHIIRSNSCQPKISKILCKFLMLLCTGKEQQITRELERSKVTEDLAHMICDGVSSSPERFHPDCVLHILMLVGHIVCYLPSQRSEFRSLDLPATLERFSSSEWNESTMAMVCMLQRLFSVSIISPATSASIVNQEPPPPSSIREVLTVGEKEWINSELSAVTL